MINLISPSSVKVFIKFKQSYYTHTDVIYYLILFNRQILLLYVKNGLICVFYFRQSSETMLKYNLSITKSNLLRHCIVLISSSPFLYDCFVNVWRFNCLTSSLSKSIHTSSLHNDFETVLQLLLSVLLRTWCVTSLSVVWLATIFMKRYLKSTQVNLTV